MEDPILSPSTCSSPESYPSVALDSHEADEANMQDTTGMQETTDRQIQDSVDHESLDFQYDFYENSVFAPISYDGLLVAKPRGSLASRRTSANAITILDKRPSHLRVSMQNSPLSLQPPKLDTLSLSLVPLSPSSTSTFLDFEIEDMESALMRQKLPLWLSTIVKQQSETAAEYIKSCFRKIERSEANRLHQSPSQDTFTCKVAHLKENAAKNRYPDIVPFDNNRVLLEKKSVLPENTQEKGVLSDPTMSSSGEEEISHEVKEDSISTTSTENHLSPISTTDSDYINASWVKSSKIAKKYIVSQGPLASTITDFWAMVCTTNTQIIVMLTLEEENGREKCHTYWPKTTSETLFFNDGASKVEFVEMEEVFAELKVTRLLLTHQGKKRKVTHVHFLGWQDYTVGYPELVLDLITYVNRLSPERDYNASIDSPSSVDFTNYGSSISKNDDSSILDNDYSPTIIVHCSAGCGRSGTFCTLDSLLELLSHPSYKDSDYDLVYAIVDEFRQQRVSMVQTLEQYAFCYKVALLYLTKQNDGVFSWQKNGLKCFSNKDENSE